MSQECTNRRPKVLILVQGGWATAVSEGSVDIEVFDEDAFLAGDSWSVPEGFERLVPDWVKEHLKQREEEDERAHST
jgi:hypothetical protein